MYFDNFLLVTTNLGKGNEFSVEKHVSRIVLSKENNEFTFAVNLDFQNAFDVLRMTVLIGKFRKQNRGLSTFFVGIFLQETKQ